MPKMAATNSQWTDDISKIERDADHAQHREIEKANHAGDHDRRIGAFDFLTGDGKRCRRQPEAPLDRRAIDGGGHHGGSRGV
jgi:hypothetical protein